MACIFYFDHNLVLTGVHNRYLSFILLGGIGAIVNVKIISPLWNMFLLLVCGLAIGCDLQYDATMAVYLFKTLGGDFIAGKLDTLEWKLSGIFAFICAASCALYSRTAISEYGRVFPILFLMQVICEYGDNHYEHLTFFRHRYSFEVIHTLLLFTLPSITKSEIKVILLDLIACSGYRFFNYLIICIRKIVASDILISAPRMFLFHLRGYFHGFKVQYVKNPKLAVAVMKESNDKGFGLERVLSCPAWVYI
jgi:hypothetical protein